MLNISKQNAVEADKAMSFTHSLAADAAVCDYTKDICLTLRSYRWQLRFIEKCIIIQSFTSYERSAMLFKNYKKC